MITVFSLFSPSLSPHLILSLHVLLLSRFIISAFSLINGVSAFLFVTFISQQAKPRQGAVFSSCMRSFHVPVFVVVFVEAFVYSLRKGNLFFGQGLGSSWCWIPSNPCILVCGNLCMRIHTCLYISLLHFHLLVWVSVSRLVGDFYFERVYCWDLASVESFVFFTETRTALWP